MVHRTSLFSKQLFIQCTICKTHWFYGVANKSKLFILSMSDLLQFAEINSDFGCNIFAINVKLQVANVYIQWHNSSFYSHQFQISSRASGARWVKCEFANSMVSIFGGIGSDSSARFTLWFDNCLL